MSVRQVRHLQCGPGMGSQPTGTTETHTHPHHKPWCQRETRVHLPHKYQLHRRHSAARPGSPASGSLSTAGLPGRCCPQSGRFGSGLAREVLGLGQGSRSQPPQGPGTGAAPHLVPTGAGSSLLGTCHQDQSSASTLQSPALARDANLGPFTVA